MIGVSKITEAARQRVFSACVVAALFLLPSAACAQPVMIKIKDLTPRFLSFYHEATAHALSPSERFALWRKDYGFAAVPPTPAGESISRHLLDSAWQKYPSVLNRIEKGAAGVEPSPDIELKRVAQLLAVKQPVDITLLVYVGALEGNAFTIAGSNGPTVAIPVEASPYERGPVMSHEFVHAVQISMGVVSGGWIRTIGETVLAEGLAMQTAAHLYPDRPRKSFVELESETGWLAKCDGLRARILGDVKKAIKSNRSDDIMRFTMGVGPAGVDREAYYAGWIVVGYWLAHGQSYADIARIKEADAPLKVGAAIDAILK